MPPGWPRTLTGNQIKGLDLADLGAEAARVVARIQPVESAGSLPGYSREWREEKRQCVSGG